ncbi:phosphoribosylformylglycinamidine cyclo-ligase [Haloarchaeobius amylolyticus]|uniref:phosphoribosylformylglycinamidine cyclo-ligase n=1 Tax=Haloarchaeobius amylolyticus TaxID=1198296 RepID=UPI002270DBBB|nr:phosphoribosylformylglycinamidine cyclo-ligase [Haloarchaeobius amylolyticus]
MTEDEDELTYADAGVDIEESEAATAALLNAVGNVVDTEYAGLLDIGDQYLGLATDGVGTKLLVAEALGDYSTVGIDCMAMNANDLVAAGVKPVAFVDYLAVDEPTEEFAEQVGEGLAEAADRADVALLGGETAVMPEVVSGLDLAGTCAGLATKEAVFDGEAQVGDRLVAWPSSGIHSNGLTLARKAVQREYDYDDPFPPAEDDRTIGEELLEPTRIYTDLLEPMHEHGVHAAAHVTGGGWTNLLRMGEFEYDITEPFGAPAIFGLVQDLGNVSPEEMYRTFNMGTGFVAAVPAEEAEALADATEDGKVIGEVTEGASVEVRGLSLD